MEELDRRVVVHALVPRDRLANDVELVDECLIGERPARALGRPPRVPGLPRPEDAELLFAARFLALEARGPELGAGTILERERHLHRGTGQLITAGCVA